MVATAVDALVLGWLADRDDALAEATLDQFATYFASLATPSPAALCRPGGALEG